MDALETNYRRAEGGYYLTAADGEALAVRPTADRDEATAGGTGLALDALLRLAVLTGRDDYRAKADVSIARISASAAQNVFGHLSVLNALDTRLAGLEIIIVGDLEGKLTEAARNLPFIARTVRPIADPGTLPDAHPARSLAKSGAAQALVCAGEVCGLPVTTPDALATNANALRRGEARSV
jgi:uncharacterized protein YyaL (SSP411 family)